ncbi:MAG: Na+-driven multidrug efflux pump [Gammaproteobacteria bacterium]|jgi:Na+-driven multidrug efflux pump
MRYRIGEVPLESTYSGTAEIVTLTVWLTLFIGIGFLVVGMKAGQRWLAIWGGITIAACAGYAAIIYFGIPGNL